MTETLTKQQQYSREYYLKNKESILEKMNEKFDCPICGGRYLKSTYQKHCRTNKHQFILELLNKK